MRLALEAGELVRADRLVEDLWAADGVSARRNTLQSKVTMLRRALGDPSVITSRDGGYALAVDAVRRRRARRAGRDGHRVWPARGRRRRVAPPTCAPRH